MKHWMTKIAYALGLTAIALACAVAAPTIANAADSVTVWRAYNKWSGEHLFTTNKAEYDNVGRNGWRLEGEAWQAPTSGEPVYRLSNPSSGDHHYTMDKGEYDRLGSSGWRQENVAFYSAPSNGMEEVMPVYRLFNPYASVGTHHYTTSLNEYAALADAAYGIGGWQQERVGWYALGTTEKLPAGWPIGWGTLIKTTKYDWAKKIGGCDSFVLNFYKYNNEPITIFKYDHPQNLLRNEDGALIRKQTNWVTLVDYGTPDKLKYQNYKDGQELSLAIYDRNNWTGSAPTSTVFAPYASTVAIL